MNYVREGGKSEKILAISMQMALLAVKIAGLHALYRLRALTAFSPLFFLLLLATAGGVDCADAPPVLAARVPRVDPMVRARSKIRPCSFLADLLMCFDFTSILPDRI
jgi:hypothetical protein